MYAITIYIRSLVSFIFVFGSLSRRIGPVGGSGSVKKGTYLKEPLRACCYSAAFCIDVKGEDLDISNLNQHCLLFAYNFRG